ncbi:MAG: hypothetical protein LBI02_01475 [Opitutaceae bacterium]|nr:hypothetical protein [Opitutaceae bacterium]
MTTVSFVPMPSAHAATANAPHRRPAADRNGGLPPPKIPLDEARRRASGGDDAPAPLPRDSRPNPLPPARFNQSPSSAARMKPYTVSK